METINDGPSTSSAVNPVKEEMRERLVQKYKDATEKLVMEQRKKVLDMKSQTSLQGLLKSSHKHAKNTDEDAKRRRTETAASVATAPIPPSAAAGAVVAGPPTLNPFKAMAAVASEWMESMGGMFPYMQPMIPGMPPTFRPPGYMGGMRGIMPSGFRGRPRGARGYYGGRGRGGYDPNYVPHYLRHQNENYENDAENEGAVDANYYNYHHAGSRYPRARRGGYPRGSIKEYAKKYSHRHRSRSRSSSYSRSRSRSRGRSHHYSKRSRTRSYSSRSRSTSRSRSKSHDRRKLVSTRRSRSTTRSSSSSRSHSRSHHSRHRSSHKHSRRSSDRSTSRKNRTVALETNEFLRTAEVIKQTIEKDMQSRMREEEREIKEQFRTSTHRGDQHSITYNNKTGHNLNNPFANGQYDEQDGYKEKSDDSNSKQHNNNSGDEELHLRIERSRSRSHLRLYDDEDMPEADEQHSEETKRKRTNTRNSSLERHIE